MRLCNPRHEAFWMWIRPRSIRGRSFWVGSTCDAYGRLGVSQRSPVFEPKGLRCVLRRKEAV